MARCRELTRSWGQLNRRLGVAAAVVLLVSAGCTEPISVSWTRVHGDRNGRDWVEASVPEDLRPGGIDGPWTIEPPQRIPIPVFLRGPDPGEATAAPVLFFGDVQGDATQELVLASPWGFTVHGLSGQEYVRVPAEGFERVPYGLIDVDGDGKLDIVMGSRLAPRPTVSGFGGTGAESFRFAVSPAEHAYSMLAVAADDDRSLWLTAREYWPTDARGLIRLDLTGQSEAASFHIPPSPLGASILVASNSGRIVVPSLITRHNGQFRSLGTLENVVSGVDANVFLLKADEDARLVDFAMLDVPAIGADRIARFYPAGKSDSAEDPVLLVLDQMLRGVPRAATTEIRNDPRPTWLYFVRVANGDLYSELELAPGALVDFRVLPHAHTDAGTTPAVITLELEGGSFMLCVRDRELRPLVTRVIEADHVALGPVAVGDERPAFFAVVDDELRVYNLRLRDRLVAPGLPAATDVPSGEQAPASPSILRRQPITNVQVAARSPLSMIYSPGREVIRLMVRGPDEVLVWEIDRQ